MVRSRKVSKTPVAARGSRAGSTCRKLNLAVLFLDLEDLIYQRYVGYIPIGDQAFQRKPVQCSLKGKLSSIFSIESWTKNGTMRSQITSIIRFPFSALAA